MTKINENYDIINSLKWKNFRLYFCGVEPIMIALGFISLMQSTVMNQYIYYRVGIDYNLTDDDNSSLAHVCKPNDTRDENTTNKLQEINSLYLFWISLGSSLTAIFTSPIYSALSDKYGRRKLYMIPGLAICLKSILESFLIYYNWSLNWFIIIETIYGLSGGYNFFMALSFSYVSDYSSIQYRTFRIGFVGVTIALGALVASTSSGYWITHSSGYFSPFLVTSIFAAIFLLFYPAFVLYSPTVLSTPPSQAPKSVLQSILSIITVHKFHSLLSVLLLLGYLCYNIGEMSPVDLQTPYLMSYPICMDSVQLGYYGSINIIAINTGVIVSSLIINRCLPDLVVVIICLIFGLAFNLQMAFAKSALAAFIATASNLFSFSGFPFLRGFMSKRVASDQQGALFGGLLFLETVSNSVSKVLMLYVYRETIYSFHGAVFCLIGSFPVLAMILIGWAYVIDKRHIQYHLLEDQD